MSAGITILLRLILAHILTDFVLQSNKWVKDKKKKKLKSVYLYLHGLVTGIAAYVFLAQWYNYQIPLFIAVTHTIIDAWKLYRKDNLFYFLADQLLHFAVLVAAWLYMTNSFNEVEPILAKAINSEKFLVYSVGFAFVIWPASYIISKATVRWRKDIQKSIKAANQAATATSPIVTNAPVTSSAAASGRNKKIKDSLEDAGMYIGMLERVLVLIFVLLDQFEAIGFLVAAKSILRFSERNEEKPRKQTEYVLIGTMISFSITIVVGLLIKFYLGQPG